MSSSQSKQSQASPTGKPRHREAAAVILVRGQSPVEVFWVERAPELAYLGGFHAFAGGGVSRRDREVRVLGVEDEAESARIAAAVRETIEEIGVVLASSVGSRRGPLPDAETLDQSRKLLESKKLTLAEFLSDHELTLHGEVFHPAGRWISPPFAPRGFDTYFYLALLPEGQTPKVHPGELVGGEWISPEQGLERWRRGEVLLAAPVRLTLEMLAGVDPGDGATDATLAEWGARLCSNPQAQGGRVERIEIVPGAVLHPLKTPTLPPATHTNCLVWGEEECLLIDPGTGDDSELGLLDELLELLSGEGRRVTALTVTHRHRDHTAGVGVLREKLGVPVWTHPDLAKELGADRVLRDGETLPFANGKAESWNVEVHFTPGHTPDHVVFFERNRGVVAAGDLISGLSTIVVDPPEGNLSQYLDSLRRLGGLPHRLLFPGHGPPMGAGHFHIEKLIRHRRWREEKIITTLETEESTVAGLVSRVYDDVDPAQWGFARRSLLAHLLSLESRGLASCRRSDGIESERDRLQEEEGDMWSLVSGDRQHLQEGS